jgi:hypothetical protein
MSLEGDCLEVEITFNLEVLANLVFKKLSFDLSLNLFFGNFLLIQQGLFSSLHSTGKHTNGWEPLP